MVAAAVLGIPLGILASRDKRIGGPVIAFVDAVQTIPSMALFGLLMAPLAALSRAFPAAPGHGDPGYRRRSGPYRPHHVCPASHRAEHRYRSGLGTLLGV